MIRLEGVSKYYKTKTGVSEGMRNISLDFKLNEFVAITGESGSGKTTLLNVISGLDSYEDGELYFNNEETSHFSVKEWEDFRAKNVGFVFQNYNVIDSYSVYQNVVISLEAQGYNESDKKQRALDLIDRVGLTSHKHQKTSKLSGGQKQRVVIARALAKNAPIILADEPTGNLDEKSGKEIMELLKEISKDKLIILVTHNYNEAKDYVTRNIIMSDGAIKDDKKVNENEYELTDLVAMNDSKKPTSFNTSLKIASRNIIATPKRTIFSVILSIVSIMVFVIFYAVLVKNQSITSGFDDENKAYIQNIQGDSLTKDQINNIKSKYNSKTINIAPNISNYKFLIVINVGDHEYEDTGHATVSSSFNENDFTGRLPQNDTEVVVSYYSNFEIGQKVAIRKDEYATSAKYFTIVGKAKDYDDLYYSEIMFKESALYDEDYNLNRDIFSSSFNLDELIVKGNDRQEIKIFKEKFDEPNFRLIDPFLSIEEEMKFVTSTMTVFFWALLIGILSIVFLVLFNVFKNVMENRKKDFAVYRSIGVSEKEVALTILIEQVLIAIIAIVATILILEISSIFVPFIRNITRHVNILDYISIGFVFAIFSLLLGLRFNKKIFNITVIDSLKEDN